MRIHPIRNWVACQARARAFLGTNSIPKIAPSGFACLAIPCFALCKATHASCAKQACLAITRLLFTQLLFTRGACFARIAPHSANSAQPNRCLRNEFARNSQARNEKRRKRDLNPRLMDYDSTILTTELLRLPVAAKLERVLRNSQGMNSHLLRTNSQGLLRTNCVPCKGWPLLRTQARDSHRNCLVRSKHGNEFGAKQVRIHPLQSTRCVPCNSCEATLANSCEASAKEVLANSAKPKEG